jgi:TonB-dependent SusC/RagA subfamily outer membrane receptor
MRVSSIVAVIALCACSSRTQQSPTPSAEASAATRMVDIGYGEMPAHLAPGAVASISQADVRLRNVRDLSELFETIPGATVERAKGRSSVRVRSVAANQSAANQEPLVIVDGVPMSRYDRGTALATLQAMDIERIDVLKDAAAAMYGVRGGRGVILVKTRSGKR